MVRRKSILGKGNRQRKDPEVRMSLGCLRQKRRQCGYSVAGEEMSSEAEEHGQARSLVVRSVGSWWTGHLS